MSKSGTNQAGDDASVAGRAPAPASGDGTATAEIRGHAAITVFYSFKGGVGRSMALYAVAHRLAARRRRVLMVDADLEAPGLTVAALDHAEARSGRGFVEIVGDVVAELLYCAEKGARLPEDLVERTARDITVSARRLEAPAPERSDLLERIREEFAGVPYAARFVRDHGILALLPAGRVYDNYASLIEQIPLRHVFEYRLTHPKRRARLREFLESAGFPGAAPEQTPVSLGDVLNRIVRQAFQRAAVPVPGADGNDDARYDYVLVDSRTGLADVSAFCVKGLADQVVVLSGLNRQNREGLEWTLDRLSSPAPTDSDPKTPPRRLLKPVHVVLSPVPEGETDLLAARFVEYEKLLERYGVERVSRLHYHPRMALSESPFTDAVRTLTRLAGDYDALALRILGMNNDSGTAWIRKALELLQGGTEAEDSLDHRHARIVEALVRAALEEPQQVENLCRALAERFDVQTNPHRLTLDFPRLLAALDPNDAAYAGGLANALGTLARRDWDAGGTEPARKRFEQAFAKYARAVEIEPNMHEAWNNWGNTLGELARREWDAGETEPARKRFEQAFAKYARAVEIEPNMHEAWNNWGNTLAELARREWDAGGTEPARKRFEQAFDKYARAVEIEPNKHEAWNNWGTDLAELARREWDAGETEPARKRFEQAFAKLDQAVVHAPKTAKNHATAAYLREIAASRAATGDWARRLRREAAEHWKQAETLSANVALFWRAVAAAQTGRTEDAIEFLRKAVEKDPKAAEAARRESLFRPLRDAPRFRELLGLPS